MLQILYIAQSQQNYFIDVQAIKDRGNSFHINVSSGMTGVLYHLLLTYLSLQNEPSIDIWHVINEMSQNKWNVTYYMASVTFHPLETPFYNVWQLRSAINWPAGEEINVLVLCVRRSPFSAMQTNRKLSAKRELKNWRPLKIYGNIWNTCLAHFLHHFFRILAVPFFINDHKTPCSLEVMLGRVINEGENNQQQDN